MMLKIALLLCALVYLTQGQEYAVLISYNAGTGCTNSATMINSQYYRMNQCSFFYRITNGTSPNTILINQYPNKDCTGTVNTYQKTLGECTTGDTTQYYWSYVSDLSSALASSGIVTYSVFGKNSTLRCSNPIEYADQNAGNCYSNNGKPTRTTCTAATKTTVVCTSSSDNTCSGTSCSNAFDTNLDKCDADSEGYYYSNSCGRSIAGVTTTQAPPTTSQTTSKTTSSNTNTNGSGSSSGSSSGSGTTGDSGSSSSSASFLSACLFMIVAPLAIYLL